MREDRSEVGWERWIRTVEIEPAIDAARASGVERSVDVLLRSGCRVFHVNGDSGRIWEAVALLAPLVHRYAGVLDVHCSGADVASLASAGADSVTVDAADDVAAAVRDAREASVQIGVAVGPGDSVPEGVDLVLCDCGDGSLGDVRQLAASLPANVVLQVEGLVTHDNVATLYRAGARLIVADEAIFGREDLPRAYRRLVQALA